MSGTVVALLPLIVAAAVLPTGIVLTLYWLRDRSGLTKAAAFAAGRLFLQLLQGLLVGYGLKAADDAAGAGGAGLVPSALLLFAGVLCLSAALVTGLRRPRPADPDAAPARWATVLRRVPAPAAFGIGASMVGFSMRQWLVTTSAVAVIDKAQLRRSHVVLAYLYFAVGAQLLILAPVAITAVVPARAARLLTPAHDWIERNKRGITVAVSLVLGVWFICQGIT